MANIKNKPQMLATVWGKYDPYILSVGMYTGSAIIQGNMKVSQKPKNVNYHVVLLYNS
jgi:hypothetical protein